MPLSLGAMELLLNSMGHVRETVLNGRKYLVTDASLLVPGVLNGSMGPLLYREQEVRKAIPLWENTPITLYHPTDGAGQNISARSPGVLDRTGLGVVRNNRWERGKHRAECWFDAERTQRISPQVYNAIKSGKPVEISTGLHTDNVINEGMHTDGRNHTHEAKNYRPDHLAILPDQVGACSINDGCGLMVSNTTPECDCGCSKKKSKLKKPSLAVNCKATGKPGPCKGQSHTNAVAHYEKHKAAGTADTLDKLKRMSHKSLQAVASRVGVGSGKTKAETYANLVKELEIHKGLKDRANAPKIPPKPSKGWVERLGDHIPDPIGAVGKFLKRKLLGNSLVKPSARF